MDSVLDVVIVLFWSTFFVATVLGLFSEYQQHEEAFSKESVLDDDDPVFLVQRPLKK